MVSKYKTISMNSLSTMILVFVLLTITSCSVIARSKILGKWETPKQTGSIDFLKDGTVIIKGEFGLGANGRYILVENDKIQFEFDDLASLLGKSTVYYTIKDDELTLDLPIIGKTMYKKKNAI